MSVVYSFRIIAETNYNDPSRTNYNGTFMSMNHDELANRLFSDVAFKVGGEADVSELDN